MEKFDKKQILKEYISQCWNATYWDVKKQELLIDEICAVFSSEIDINCNIFNKIFDDTGTYKDALKILEAKLINYVANLERQDQLREYELEKLKMQQSNFSVNNTNNNNLSSESTSTSQSIIDVTINNAFENLQKIPENILNNDEKDKLEDMLSSIEISKKNNNREKVIDKIGKTLKYVVEKGTEVGIAVLPYLGEISKFINK